MGHGADNVHVTYKGDGVYRVTKHDKMYVVVSMYSDKLQEDKTSVFFTLRLARCFLPFAGFLRPKFFILSPLLGRHRYLFFHNLYFCLVNPTGKMLVPSIWYTIFIKVPKTPIFIWFFCLPHKEINIPFQVFSVASEHTVIGLKWACFIFL